MHSRYVDACNAKERMFGSKEENSLVEQRTDDSGEDKKLRGTVRNMSSASCFSSSDCIEVFEKPGRLSGQEFVGKDETEKVKRSEITTRLKCGSVSVIGRRRVMEDALTVAPGMMGGEYEFFAVYNGHGGAMVANACRERLHQLLENELDVSSMDIPKDKPTMSGGENGVDWIKVMKACFSKMDDEVLTDGSGVGAGEAERAVGTTAVVVLVGTEELVVANCGDSRAVLCRSGVAMPLSNDHKADRPDEKERVEAAGGRIINWDGCRVQGVLATSRSIGDHYLKPYVISEPEVTVNKRTDSDDFLIIASDGLWDVVSNGVACDVARRCLNGRISKKISKESSALADAAAILVELAIAKGSRDNISVIVVDIKKASNKISRA